MKTDRRRGQKLERWRVSGGRGGWGPFPPSHLPLSCGPPRASEGQAQGLVQEEAPRALQTVGTESDREKIGIFHAHSFS